MTVLFSLSILFLIFVIFKINKKNNTLSEFKTAHEKSQQEILDLNKDLDKARAEDNVFSKFRVAHEKSQKEILDLKKELDKANDEVTALSKFKIAYNESQREIIDLKKELNKTKTEGTFLSKFSISNKKLQHEIIELKKELNQAQSEVASLAKYKTIQDVEIHVQYIKEQITRDQSTAHENAKAVVLKAEEEAKKIAGDALEAAKNVNRLEKAAQAFKNVIEGYGDQYIIPTYSLLDRLAEDYSYTKAGEELKRAREKTRTMIKNGTAALCEYVESNRKETAIDFVLDAFNGKVDTIFSSVKDDNFGTLSQKIRDAFQTVNFNGKAFRDARIADVYLAARLDELNWACTVHAIKEKDKEEQRRIRDQIREEEKAAKEYEKAIKDAQKEEDTLAKAMEKVKKQMESATEKQKEEYELKLKDFEEKLRLAEEKNKRALSLAQQTKTGHVYIISNVGSFGENVLKIGLTRRLDPMDRVYELGDASVPFDFDVHAMILSEDAPALEKELHKTFHLSQVNKVNPRKEFFNIKISDIKETVERMGIQAQWTMQAEAREYKESQSLNTKRQVA